EIKIKGSMVGTTQSLKSYNGTIGFPGSLQDLLITSPITNGSKTGDLKNIQQNLENSKKFLTKIGDAGKSYSELHKNLNVTLAKYENNTTRLGKLIYNSSRGVSNIVSNKSVREVFGSMAAIAGIGVPVLGIAGSLVSLFAKSPTPEATTFQPTITRSMIELDGTITSNLNESPISFIAPGALFDIYNSLNQDFFDKNGSYFNCPVGLITLKETPKVSEEKYTTFSSYLKETVNQTGSCNQNRDRFVDEFVVKNIKATTDELKFIVNQSTELEVVDGRVAFVTQYENYHPTGVDLTGDGHLYTFDQGAENIWCGKRSYYRDKATSNMIYKMLLSGELEFTDFNHVNTNLNNSKLRTPFVPLQCYSQLKIKVPQNFEVALRVQLFLRSKHELNGDVTTFTKDFKIQTVSSNNITVNHSIDEVVSPAKPMFANPVDGYASFGHDLQNVYVGIPPYGQNVTVDNFWGNFKQLINNNKSIMGLIFFKNFSNRSVFAEPYSEVSLDPGFEFDPSVNNKIFDVQLSQRWLVNCAQPFSNSMFEYKSFSGCDGINTAFNESTYRVDNESSGDYFKNISHPNPVSNGYLYFGNKTSQYQFMDSKGNILSQGLEENKLDISSFPSGLYILKTDNSIEKIVINK
ncbi:MAG: hypothetical protein SNJ77_04215, partial [Cytophagales bacterium]